ncbi:hypothetical protein SZ05_23790 [Vibrio parahaemolyticus]|nr:hypothetical protein SZ05_23790 [Vibrio parahaemolyticus]
MKPAILAKLLINSEVFYEVPIFCKKIIFIYIHVRLLDRIMMSKITFVSAAIYVLMILTVKLHCETLMFHTLRKPATWMCIWLSFYTHFSLFILNG